MTIKSDLYDFWSGRCLVEDCNIFNDKDWLLAWMLSDEFDDDLTVSQRNFDDRMTGV